jgi:hypothetical protein
MVNKFNIVVSNLEIMPIGDLLTGKLPARQPADEPATDVHLAAAFAVKTDTLKLPAIRGFRFRKYSRANRSCGTARPIRQPRPVRRSAATGNLRNPTEANLPRRQDNIHQIFVVETPVNS